jgi:hypothetical protein
MVGYSSHNTNVHDSRESDDYRGKRVYQPGELHLLVRERFRFGWSYSDPDRRAGNLNSDCDKHSDGDMDTNVVTNGVSHVDGNVDLHPCAHVNVDSSACNGHGYRDLHSGADCRDGNSCSYADNTKALQGA